jgi:hypothetical protein
LVPVTYYFQSVEFKSIGGQAHGLFGYAAKMAFAVFIIHKILFVVSLLKYFQFIPITHFLKEYIIDGLLWDAYFDF